MLQHHLSIFSAPIFILFFVVFLALWWMLLRLISKKNATNLQQHKIHDSYMKICAPQSSSDAKERGLFSVLCRKLRMSGAPAPREILVPNKYRCSDDHVRYDASVDLFISSDRNTNVAFIPHSEMFQYVVPGRDTPVRAKGITKIIKAAYFADYTPKYTNGSFAKQKKKNERAKLKGKTSKQILRMRAQDQRLKGFTLGTLVHDELCDWGRIRSEEEWRAKHPTPNMYTVKVIRALKIMKLEPLYGEWPIYDEHIPYATSIDLVCASGTENGRLVVVEIKTGYQGYFTNGSGPMTRTPLKRVPNSPLNQAYLQCLMAKVTLEKRYGLTHVYGMVLRVHERGVKAYPLPDEFLRRQDSIYNGVKRYMEERFPPRTRTKGRGAGGAINSSNVRLIRRTKTVQKRRSISTPRQKVVRQKRK